MRPFGVVELEVIGQVLSGVVNVFIRLQVYLLIFDRTPQSLGKYVVHATASAVHGYLYAVPRKNFNEIFVGKLAALVRVRYLRHSMSFDRRFHRLHAEARFQGWRQAPSDHISAPPVDDGIQVAETVSQTDVGDVTTPYVIRARRSNVSQEIRVYLVIGVFDACFLDFGIYSFQTHDVHQPAYMVTTERNAVHAFQVVSYSSGTVEWTLGEDSVDLFHRDDIGLIYPRFIVEA